MNSIFKCHNCSKKVTQDDIDNKKGYLIHDVFTICDKCYFIYLNRVREYLYKAPGATMEEIAKGSKLPLSLISLFYNEGALDAIKNEINNKEIEIQTNEEKEAERLRKLQLARSLGGVNYPNGLNKVIDAKPKMRYFSEDIKKR